MHETLSQEVEGTASSVDAERLLTAQELVTENVFRTQRSKYTVFRVWLVTSISGYGFSKVIGTLCHIQIVLC